MPKILVIEDDNILSKAIVEVLHNEDFETDLLKSGGGVLEKIEKFQPDLVLLDLFLPEKPGEVVLKEIRENPTTRELPVIILTVKTDQESVKQCQEYGASEYLIKAHYTLEEIIKKVKKVLRGA